MSRDLWAQPIKRCTELHSDSTQILDSGLSVPIGLSEISKKVSKPAGENISRIRPARGTTRRCARQPSYCLNLWLRCECQYER